jgi:hypothetical protein
MLRWDDVVVTREERRDMFLNETHCATNRTFQICFSIATKKNRKNCIIWRKFVINSVVTHIKFAYQMKSM